VDNAEFNYLDGVTGAIQAQLNAKAVAADVLNDTMTLKGLVDVK